MTELTELPARSATDVSSGARHLAISIAWHWDVSRIGETAIISSGQPINRNTRPFAPSDSIVSREPFFVARTPRGIVVRPSPRMTLETNDRVIQQETRFSAEELDHGIPFLVNNRLFFVLHEIEELPRTDSVPMMVGVSSNVSHVRRFVEKHRGTMSTILIRGPSGSGKELVARALAEGHPPLWNQNLAQVTDQTQVNSMLFGHVKGAYTGASDSRRGLLQREGTVFLDEIGDVPPDVQKSLLKVLDEDGVFTPLGAERPDRLKARIVTGTDADLEARMADGTFHPALFYRLDQATVRLRPLRERRADIGPIFRKLLDELRVAIPARTPRDEPFISEHHFFALLRLHLSGNVRELRMYARAAAEAWSGTGPFPLGTVLKSPPPLIAEPALLRKRSIADISDDELRAALEAVSGNQKAAAEDLGVSRSALQRRLGRSTK